MKDRPTRFALYCLLLVLIGIVRCLPRFLALIVARFGGWVTYYIVPKQRRRVDRNLAYAFPDKTQRERRRIGNRVFQNVAQTLIDLILFNRLNAKNLDKWLQGEEAFDMFRALLKKGKGVIVLTAHFGNWEMVGASIMLRGFPGAAVVRRIYYEPYNRLLTGIRERCGVRGIYRDSSPREMLRVLHENGALGIAPDQDVDSVDGVFIDFFGHPAHTPTAPVKMAMVTGAPILPAVVVREGLRYRFLVGEPIECRPEENKEEAVRRYTEQWSSTIEGFIRHYPDQWMWMHDRWKTKL